jgi:hypothetical protein
MNPPVTPNQTIDSDRQAGTSIRKCVAHCAESETLKSFWRADMTSAASIVPVPIHWLWPGWIARGKLTVLAGAGGSGKTTLAISLIGILTSGGRWPDGERCHEPANVLIWSSEDDPADTLVPRLMAAGANLERVHIIQWRARAIRPGRRLQLAARGGRVGWRSFTAAT